MHGRCSPGRHARELRDLPLWAHGRYLDEASDFEKKAPGVTRIGCAITGDLLAAIILYLINESMEARCMGGIVAATAPVAVYVCHAEQRCGVGLQSEV